MAVRGDIFARLTHGIYLLIDISDNYHQNKTTMKRLTFLLLVIAFITINSRNEEIKSNDIYFGQRVPKDRAEVFSPGFISSGLNDRDIAISPDNSEIFYCIIEEPHFTIVQIKRDAKGDWGKPQIAPFSGLYNDCEPMFSPNGKRLYFCSNRPLDGSKGEKDYDIWYVEKTAEDWSKPVNLGSPVNTGNNEFYPSLTSDDTLYFTSSNMKIMMAKYQEGVYQKPEMLSDSINTRVGEYNAVISPDESFLIYTSHGWPDDMGQGDLYISFRKPDGTWTKARNLGAEINSSSTEMSPSLSPDGKLLFFASNRMLNQNDNGQNITYDDLQRKALHYDNGRFNIFWVDIKTIIKQ